MLSWHLAAVQQGEFASVLEINHASPIPALAHHHSPQALLTNLYPFPVTATWLQLVGVSTVMCLGRLVHSQGVNTVASTAADVPNTVIEDPQALHKVQTPTPHHHGQIDVWFKWCAAKFSTVLPYFYTWRECCLC